MLAAGLRAQLSAPPFVAFQGTIVTQGWNHSRLQTSNSWVDGAIICDYASLVVGLVIDLHQMNNVYQAKRC